MATKHKVVYGGTYTYEGHDVNFQINEDGETLIVTESKDGFTTQPVKYSIDDAINYQSDLVKWGYKGY